MRLCLFLFLFTSFISAYIPGRFDFVSLPYDHGLFSNPAGIRALGSSGALLGGGVEKGVRSFRAGVHSESFGGAFEYLTNDKGFDETRWSFSQGFSFLENIFFLGYRAEAFRSADFDGTDFSLSPGAIFRPFTFLSLGYFGKNLLEMGPGSSYRIHEFGMALRAGGFLLGYNISDFKDHKILAAADLFGFSAGLEIPIAGGGDYRFTLSHSLGMSAHASIAFGEDIRPHEAYLSYHRAKTPKASSVSIVRVALGAPVREEGIQGFPFLREPTLGIQDIREQMYFLKKLPSASVIIFDFSGYEGGWAVSKEIQRGIRELRKSGKKTIAFLDDVRPSTLIASISSEYIVGEPSARVTFRGFGGTTLFYKGLLSKLGVQVEFLRHGKYKSAVEPYMADSMSKEARENLEQIYRARWDLLASEWKPSSRALLDSLASFPQVTASSAVRTRLLDTTLYLEEVAPYAMKKFYGLNTPLAKASLFSISPRKILEDNWGRRPRFALITLEGTITEASAKKILREIEEVYAGNFSALLLRINSPGGSAQASDKIWASLRDLSKRGIPIVASIGDYGASGGYYIACGADKIIAENFSLVGSIGIYGGKINLSGLLEKLDIRKESVKTHEHADAETWTRGFDSYERASLQEFMDDFYERFLKVVSRATNIPKHKIDRSLGDGRVFVGKEAFQKGLVHNLGGLDTALEELKALAKISEKIPVEIVPLSGGHSKIYRSLPSKTSIPFEEILAEFSEVKVWAIDPRFMEVP